MKKDMLEIKKLVEELNRYSYTYYVLNNSDISDKEFDKKYDKLLKLEKETGIILPNSPTQRVGDIILKGFGKVIHRNKLWSLDKAQNKDEVKNFTIRIDKFVKEYNATHEDKLPKPKYVLTKKFDGISINCTYNEKGDYEKGGSRGDGVEGENITAQIGTMINLPKHINNDFSIDVHGEALMSKKSFEEYNKTAETPLKNLRNGAAGALRNLNIKEAGKRKIFAMMYDLSYCQDKNFETYTETLEFMKELGFTVAKYRVCSTLDEIFNYIDNLNEIRSELPFDIDGVVITVDDLKTRELLGVTAKFPKHSIAYKFEAMETTTKLLNVLWQVSRSGRVNPVAEIEPVELMGVTVKRATLNNVEDIKRKKVKINAQVFVKRANDVVPELMGVVEDSLNNLDVRDIIIPEECPYCHSKLEMEGAYLVCNNTLGCRPQLIKSIVHFCSKEAMNIAGFSDKTAEIFIEKGIISSIPDLYNLQSKKPQIISLDKFGEKKYNNIINAIEKSRKAKLPFFLYALGIDNVGHQTSKDIVKHFNTLDKIKLATVNDLITIKDVGPETADSIYKFFHNPIKLQIIDKLLEYISFSIEKTTKIKSTESFFYGKTIVVTGTFKNYNRSEIKDKLESLGAKVTSSVSKKTDYVIYGEAAGSKYDDAISLGVKLLTEEEFEEKISGDIKKEVTIIEVNKIEDTTKNNTLNRNEQISFFK